MIYLERVRTLSSDVPLSSSSHGDVIDALHNISLLMGCPLDAEVTFQLVAGPFQP